MSWPARRATIGAAFAPRYGGKTNPRETRTWPAHAHASPLAELFGRGCPRRDRRQRRPASQTDRRRGGTVRLALRHVDPECRPADRRARLPRRLHDRRECDLVELVAARAPTGTGRVARSWRVCKAAGRPVGSLTLESSPASVTASLRRGGGGRVALDLAASARARAQAGGVLDNRDHRFEPDYAKGPH